MESVILFALFTLKFILPITIADTAIKSSQQPGIDAVVDDNDPINWSTDKFIKNAKKNLDTVLKSALPAMMGTSDGLSQECTRSLLYLGSQMRKFKKWPFQMLDATSKFYPGVLMGTLFGFGSYDECVDLVVEDKNNKSKEMFRGQYCTVMIKPPKSMERPIEIVANESGIRDFESTVFSFFSIFSEVSDEFSMGMGICLPSTCSDNDVQHMFAEALRPLGLSPSVSNCIVKSPPKINMTQIIVSCIFTAVAVLCTLGTTIDALSYYSTNFKLETKTTWRRTAFSFFKEFSIYSNTKKFLEGPNYGGKLDVLSGMRLISTTWVVIGHSFFFPDPLHLSIIKDVIPLLHYQRDIPFMVILNMAICMDTFFVISGFLTAYNSWHAMANANGKLPPFSFVMRRVMRLLPVQLLVIGILILMPLFGDGPLWERAWTPKVEGCQNYWWTNLLFVQNFFKATESKSCLFQSWYISVLMQLHIIAFFLLILLYKKPVFGVSITIVLSAASCLAVSLVTYFKNYPASVDADPRAFKAFMSYDFNVYTQLYSHLAPYCMGVLFAFFIVKKHDKPRFRGNWRTAGWIGATAVALASLYGLHSFTDYSWIDQPPFLRVFYAGFHRTGWAFAITWVIYDCILQPEGIVNSILTWRPLIHLDSLGFLVYMVHPLVISYHQARSRDHINSDHIDLIYYVISNVVLTYMVSFLLHVTVEQPINSAVAALLKKRKLQKTDLESQVKETC